MRTILWISVLFLLALCGCEELDAIAANQPTTVADAGVNPDSGQAVDAGTSPDSTSADDHGSTDTSSDADTMSAEDQSVTEVELEVKTDPCADWNWMKQHQWKCPEALNLDIKFQLQIKQGICRATSKIFDLPASELVCDKENKGFSFYEPQMNDTFSCVPIE